MDEDAFVIDVVHEIEEEEPPQLFDLTGLQKEANFRYGLTAKETLDCAQRLYEEGMLSYPRTSSHNITPDMEQSVSELLSSTEGANASAPVDGSAARTSANGTSLGIEGTDTRNTNVLDGGDLQTKPYIYSDVNTKEIYEIAADTFEVKECLGFTSMDAIRKDSNLKSFEEDFAVAFEKAGISKEDYIKITHKPMRELSSSEIDLIVKINESVPNPSNNTLMSKVISETVYKNYIENGSFSGTVGNCVTRAQDMQDCESFNDYYNKLGLNYKNNPFDNADKLYVIRYTSPDTESLVVKSYGGTCIDDVNRAKDVLGLNDRNTFLNDDPYLGTGITKDVEGGIGKLEFMTQRDVKGNATYCSIDDGSAIYEVDKNIDGEKIVAIRIEGKWYTVKGVEKNDICKISR